MSNKLKTKILLRQRTIFGPTSFFVVSHDHIKAEERQKAFKKERSFDQFCTRLEWFLDHQRKTMC